MWDPTSEQNVVRPDFAQWQHQYGLHTVPVSQGEAISKLMIEAWLQG